jgi:Fe-S cluster assembly ATPase SufC
MPDLEIRNLHVQADDKPILKGLDLTVRDGEVHALMGPNGSASRPWPTRSWGTRASR